MKTVVILIVSILVCGCHMATNRGISVANTTPSVPLASNYSHPQLWIYELKQQYIVEYNRAESRELKKEILKKYQTKLHHFLMDSCQKIIDCGHVYIKNIKKEISIGSDLISGNFTDKSSIYTFASSYAKDEDPNDYPEYNLLSGLKEGTDLSLKFLYTGDCNVLEPTDLQDQIFIIRATPYVE
ncbi:MAG: hypothetical protein NVS1B13_13590 [Flavisolibacter sp.]